MRISPIVISFLTLLTCLQLLAYDVFQDFDLLPVTASGDAPESGGGWTYSTADSRARWTQNAAYASPNETLRNSFYNYLNSSNNDHIGFSTYGYLEIDDGVAVSGNSLRYVITGGINNDTLPGSNGLPLTNKQEYLDYQASGANPDGSGSRVGHPYLYFANGSNSVPFPEAQGANRLSMYIYIPVEADLGEGGWGQPVKKTLDVGPFNGNGDHWYHHYAIEGGGWAHVQVDAHPQHNNGWSSADDYPYPSRSLRDRGSSYFDDMYRWYVTFKPYAGLATPPYSVWYDEIQFTYDSEPQNTETIASPAILYKQHSQSFELSLMDKYKNNQYSYSTYELRYSFAPITNANWNSAIPVHVIEDLRFSIEANSSGRFEKWWPYYQQVWAPFTLASQSDLDLLLPGTILYFAIKDVSQLGGDGLDAISAKGGRDYRNHGDTFDYAGDQAVLNLIRRIEYQIPQTSVDPYIVWKSEAFTDPENAETSPGADYDKDGKANLFEYLFCMNPESSINAREPHAILINDGLNYPGLVYTRRSGSTNIVEFSTSVDLLSWSSWGVAGTDFVELGVSPNGDGTEEVTLRYHEAFANESKIFMRIRVIEN